MDVELVVVGSGQDAGNPQFGRIDGIGPERTASSVAVIVDSDVILLFDASPDLRHQYRRIVSRAPHRTARTPVDAVFVTHAHMGHYGGLIHFGKESANTEGIPLHAPSSVLEYLDANEPWASLMRQGNLIGHATEDGPGRYGPISVTAIPVPHRADLSTAVAFSVTIDDAPWVLYVPDIDAWDQWPEAHDILGRHRIGLLDATFGDPGELGHRPMAAVPHPLVDDTITRFGDLVDDVHLVLTHLNHTNRFSDPASVEHRRAVAAGFSIAHDGMVLGADGNRA
jgi:pyrroloquinoline quinone biosynthesis protein B